MESVVIQTNGHETEHRVDGVLSNIPLVSSCSHSTRPLRKRCRRQRAELRYRDLVVVAVMTSDPEPFPDNWIYVHDPSTRAGRVQNFGAWSPDMVRPGTTCLGVEYFCFEGDDIWRMPNDEAVKLASTSWRRSG